MTAPAYGMNGIVVDGPPPAPPALSLVGASRIVNTPGDRWINGASVWPYPRDLPDVFDPCQETSSAGHAKAAGTPSVPETFGAYNVLEGITCTTGSFAPNPGEWQRRVEASLEAYEHWAIEREFWSGALKPDNPHLAQTSGLTYDNSGTTTSIKNAIALLEQAIADKGGNGVIHLRPAVFSQLAHEGGIPFTVQQGVARTQLGTILVPGVGYPGSPPAGSAISGTVEYAYATGPIEVRRSEVFLTPETMREATDRASNTTTFRAERYVLVTWDQRIHAAVKIDRSFSNFTS